MKYITFLIIFNLSFCLQAKKSPFDINSPRIGMFGAIFLAFSNSGDTTPPAVTVTNLKSKGTLETGLLIGTASDNVGVTSVEVQINSGAYAAATTLTSSTTTTGTKDWTYKITLTAKWTYAFTNTVNVRVKDTSGNTTVTSLTSVQKGENHDMNGDGFADLVVGAPSYNSNQGRVYVFNGSANGITQTSTGSASQTFTGTTTQKFGSSVAMTDTNGDGFADMVVCEFGGGGTNSSFYYLGGANGFGDRITIAQVGSTEYCRALTVGDFNSDGYGDVAISNSTSAENGGNGNVYIYRGNSSGLNISPIQVLIGGTTNLGMNLTSGDINGDGKTDLVARTSSSPYIVSFLSDGSNLVISSTITTVVGSQLALGDFNGDGKADLAVGNTGLDAGLGASQGRVYIFTSNGSTLNTTASQTIDGDGAGFEFTPSLFAGDVNQDGVTDLIAGNPKGDFNSIADNGAIYFFHGCVNTGLCNGSGTASAKANLRITGVTVSSYVGSAFSFKDLNRDGFPDLIASAVAPLGSPVIDGTIQIFNGSANGITATSISSASKTITGTGSSTEQFGTSLY